MTIITENLPFCSNGEISDIEDVFKNGIDGIREQANSHGGDNGNNNNNTNVKIHMKRRKKFIMENNVLNDEPGLVAAKEFDENAETVTSNDVNPANYKIYMKTWGCSHNTSDSEYMAGLLSYYGFQISDDKEKSQVWILNSCTVKGPSEQHFKNEVENGRKLNKKVIVSGCVPQGEPRSDYIKGLSIIGVKQIDEIVNVVEESLKGNTVRLLSFKKKNTNIKNPPGASLNFPKIRKNELIEIIPISTGCLNSCTYCKTKLARGHLSSYAIDDVVGRLEQVTKHEGVKEIWLTSEDLGAWGIDIDLTIVDLLKELVNYIPPDCMLRLGMTNPPYILDHLAEMADILNHSRVYGFLHIPIQSGSNEVLQEMKREYTKNQFEHIVNFLKKSVPSLTIATDIICGFPTETEQDFQETYDLVQKHKFSILYINQFYPRPGTVAAKMARIPNQIVKTRTKRLSDLFFSYQTYDERRIGQVYKNVLVTEISHDKLHFVGHNKAYEQILIKPKKSFLDCFSITKENTMGRRIDVKIISVSKFSMVGEPILLHGLNNGFILACFIVLFLAVVLFRLL